MALVTFNFWQGKAYAFAGYWIRRTIWNGSEGGHELAWIFYYRGLWYYTNGTITRVVTSDDFAGADMLALDWTLQNVAGDDLPNPPPPIDELPTEQPSDGGNTPGGRNPDNPNENHNPPPDPKPKPPAPPLPPPSPGPGGDPPPAEPPGGNNPPSITNPTLTVDAIITGCSLEDEGQMDTRGLEVSFTLGTNTNAPPGVWFYTMHINHAGMTIHKNGQASPGGGDTQVVTVQVIVGDSYTVRVQAYKPNSSFYASGMDSYSLEQCYEA